MHSRPTQAVILAGGRGTRLAPLTDNLPKALIPFHGKPFLGYVIEMLREQGFKRVLLLLGYMADAMIEHFGGGSAYGVEISYRATDADDLTAYQGERRRRSARRPVSAPVLRQLLADAVRPHVAVLRGLRARRRRSPSTRTRTATRGTA